MDGRGCVKSQRAGADSHFWRRDMYLDLSRVRRALGDTSSRRVVRFLDVEMAWHCWYSSSTVSVWLLAIEAFCSELNSMLQGFGGCKKLDWCCWSNFREEPEPIKLFFNKSQPHNLRFNARTPDVFLFSCLIVSFVWTLLPEIKRWYKHRLTGFVLPGQNLWGIRHRFYGPDPLPVTQSTVSKQNNKPK